MKTISISMVSGVHKTVSLYKDGSFLCVTRGVKSGYAITHKETGVSVAHLPTLRRAKEVMDKLDGEDWKFESVAGLSVSREVELKKLIDDAIFSTS